jgi:hypothetical protein
LPEFVGSDGSSLCLDKSEQLGVAEARSASLLTFECGCAALRWFLQL